MKKYLYILFIFIIGCGDYELPDTVELIINIYYPEQFHNGKPIVNEKVSIINKQTGRKFSKTTDERGVVIFNVRGGVYDVIFSSVENHILENDQYLTTKPIQFFATLNNEKVLSETYSYALTTDYKILTDSFVIKELYSSGSRTSEGKLYYPDIFIEIYNNTNHFLYSDGLCFGVVRYKNTYTPNPWKDENGQISNNIPVWSYVAVVPGNGEDYPVAPGESIILALSAINHKTDPNGNPNSIDLSFSNWEMYIEDGKFADNPAVPNLIMHQIHQRPYSKTISFNVNGQVVILFRIPKNNYSEFFNSENNYSYEPGGTERCLMIPSGWVIDGVENAQKNSVVYKRLPNFIDSGFIQHKGKGEGVAIRRKVKEIDDGRIIYLDTNNSSDDFETNVTPTPEIFGTK